MKQEWILCDLHTHSMYSKINKTGDKDKVIEMTAANFVNTLASKGVKLFSVTDHNYFSKKFYDEIEQYIESSKKDMKVICGAELDATVETKESTNEFIHICFYFDSHIDRDKLEKCINKLYKNEDNQLLTPSLSQILESLYTLNTRFILIPHGDKESGLFKIVREQNLYEKKDFYKYAMYKIFNAFVVKPNFYESSIKHWALNFYENTSAFDRITSNLSAEQEKQLQARIVSKIKDDSVVLNNDEQQIYEYIMSYGSYFAYFSFSDWHNAKEYSPKINNFIFGSMDLPFESLEMATLDPVSRIQLSKERSIEIPDTILSEVSFKVKGQEHNVKLSPGLNAIVGKRGSGKSLFLSVIKNLVDKDADDGALKKYKSLNIEGIGGADRGGIPMSPGGLSSAVFLSQNKIDDIFDNPSKSENEINKYFKDVAPFNNKRLCEISELAKNIKPFDKNYKNITTMINVKFTGESYNLSKYSFNVNQDVFKGFTDAIDNLEKARKILASFHINTNDIDMNIESISKSYRNYQDLIGDYTKIICSHNNRIAEEIKNYTSNQKIAKTNMSTLDKVTQTMLDNLEIKMNFEKLKKAINHYMIDDLPIEVNRKGKYVFVTYYEVPETIEEMNESIQNEILRSINRGKSMEDIEKYLNCGKSLNKDCGSIAHYLDMYLASDHLKAKKSFFEVNNFEIDYQSKIKNRADLNSLIESKNLIDLTNASLGTKSVAYLDMLFNLDNNILIIDQPEDNIDNQYISQFLVPIIKASKRVKQLIFVTHNPSIAVYGDAFNYILVENESDFSYKNYFIEKPDDKETLMKILEGGRDSFSNRNKKFGNVLGAEEHGNN